MSLNFITNYESIIIIWYFHTIIIYIIRSNSTRLLLVLYHYFYYYYYHHRLAPPTVHRIDASWTLRIYIFICMQRFLNVLLYFIKLMEIRGNVVMWEKWYISKIKLNENLPCVKCLATMMCVAHGSEHYSPPPRTRLL